MANIRFLPLSLVMLAAVFPGCTGSTDWKPVSDQILKKYEDRLIRSDSPSHQISIGVKHQ